MVQLKTQRVALALYSVLLVLPTLVLGGLHGYQLFLDHQREMKAVPRSAESAALRLQSAIERRLEELLAAEDRRSFTHYADFYVPDDVVGGQLSLRRSPFLTTPPPRGILGWFSFDRFEEEPQVRVFSFADAPPPGDHALQEPPLDEVLERAGEQYIASQSEDSFLTVVARLGEVENLQYPVPVVVVNRADPLDRDGLEACYEIYRDRLVEVEQSAFHLQAYREADGALRLVATRRAIVFNETMEEVLGDQPDPACISPLRGGFALVQGIFLDPHWFFSQLPGEEAGRVLGESLTFVPAGEVRADAPSEPGRLRVRPLDLFDFEVRSEDDRGEGQFEVYIDTAEIEDRFRQQMWQFAAVAAMLLLTLGTGVVLLLRNVSRELDQAQRTSNFVAAVTHELRTPLSAIRLHGEMLAEGWTDDEAQRQEYYRRIVRETTRLGTLVDRVLEKSRLSSGTIEPEPGDLSAAVEILSETLGQASGGDGEDLIFELEPGLPRVWLHPLALEGLLVNLVENARKYAPVQPQAQGAAAEPIRVRTAMAGGRVVLEVLDRGPGVPAGEAERIFEAFYRVGNEATRTSQGTGLGLHLVSLHAASMEAQASVEPRAGGGAAFRVTFRRV